MRIQKHSMIFMLFILVFLACGPPSPPPDKLRNDPVDDAVEGANPMVHQQGMQIVDPDGNPLELRGVFLEGWLQWNGTLWGAGFLAESELAERLTALVGPEEFAAFQTGIYDNFITEQDIEMIANIGFNVVRVPINHTILENETGQVDPSAAGWAYLDRLLTWCELHGVYVVPDLHAAPGGQSPWFTADPEPVKLWESEENQARTVAIWRAIAERYHDRTIIAGYDLLNEPDFPNGDLLIDLYIRIIEAIREVDPYHMIILEGNKLATDFSIFDQPLSSNTMYSFHTYNLFSEEVDTAKIEELAELAVSQQAPLWNSEFGANTLAWTTSVLALFEDPENHVSGWTFWPWKRIPQAGARYRHLMAIPSSPAWDRVRLVLSLSENPQEMITQQEAVAGMGEFLDLLDAEKLVPDQEMMDLLSGYVDD